MILISRHNPLTHHKTFAAKRPQTLINLAQHIVQTASRPTLMCPTFSEIKCYSTFSKIWCWLSTKRALPEVHFSFFLRRLRWTLPDLAAVQLHGEVALLHQLKIVQHKITVGVCFHNDIFTISTLSSSGLKLNISKGQSADVWHTITWTVHVATGETITYCIYSDSTLAVIHGKTLTSTVRLTHQLQLFKLHTDIFVSFK